MICEGPATERRWLVKLRTAVWPIAIFFLSLWLRTRNLDADVYGDEAYYYYLCMYPERYLTLYRNHPPLTYLVYHAAAESVQATRILNATIGASIPVVVYVYLKGSKSSVRVLASILAATATVLVRYSGLVFPDTFSSFLFLVGLLLYEKRRWLPASGLLGLSALAKEYAVLGAAILICISYFRYRSLRIAVLLGFGLALAGPVLYYFMFHLGGSYFLLFVAHDDPLRSIWNLFLFLSLLAILLAGLLGHLEEFVISSAYAVFIVWWRTSLDWYLVLPLPLTIICLAYSLERLLPYAKQVSADLQKRDLFRALAKGTSLLFLVLLIGSFTVLNITRTAHHIVEWHPKDLQQLTDFLSREGHAERQVTMIDCSWTYRFYPFNKLTVAYCDYTSGRYHEDYYAVHIEETKLAILCNLESGDVEIRKSLLNRFREFVIYSSREYTVISLPGGGDATIPYRPHVTLTPIDHSGKVLTRLEIGKRIFFRGRLTEGINGTVLRFRPVHLYAKLLLGFLTSHPGEIEWNSEITDAGGYYDTRWVNYPFQGNLPEWLEVREDGVYANGESKIWSGNPQRLSLTFYADFLWSTREGDIYNKSRESVLAVCCSRSQWTVSVKSFACLQDLCHCSRCF